MAIGNGNSTRNLVFFVGLVVIAAWGCDRSTPVDSAVHEPTAVISSAPVQMEGTGTDDLHVVILPISPTVKTALYARVSGAREPVRLTWLKNGETIEGEIASSLGLEHLHKGDIIEVEAISGDLRGISSVEIDNSPPTLSSVNFNYGSVVTVEPCGEDPDGDTINYRYQWLVNEQEVLLESTNVLPEDFFAKGDRITVVITPYDDETDGVTARVQDVMIANKPPVISSTPPAFFEGGEFSYQVAATDPEGEGLIYSIDTAPEGMTIDHQTGGVFWRAEAAPGPHLVKIKVSDTSGRWSVQQFTLELRGPEGE